MSDISIHFPLWIALVLVAVQFWPVPFAFGALFAFMALMVRKGWRAVLFVLAFAMMLPGAGRLVIWQQKRQEHADYARYEEATNSTLDAPQMIDGFLLPAGTQVHWMEPAHEHLRDAWLEQPAPAAGLTLNGYLARETDGWTVTLSEDGAVEGWLCQAKFVRLDSGRHLAQCSMAADTIWKGWQLPRDTLVEIREPDGLVGLVLPRGTTLNVPQVGTVTPAGGFSVFSDDGAMHRIYFDNDMPLVVHDVRLWNTVTWLYSGQAHRPGGAAAVTGTLIDDVTQAGEAFPRGNHVRIDLNTGRLALCASGCGE